MLFVTWFTVDGCYVIYWHFKDLPALEMMRAAISLPHYPLTDCAAFGYIKGVSGRWNQT